MTQYRLAWTTDQLTWYSSLLTTVTNVSAMIASFGAGYFVSNNLLRFTFLILRKDQVWQVANDSLNECVGSCVGHGMHGR